MSHAAWAPALRHISSWGKGASTLPHTEQDMLHASLRSPNKLMLSPKQWRSDSRRLLDTRKRDNIGQEPGLPLPSTTHTGDACMPSLGLVLRT